MGRPLAVEALCRQHGGSDHGGGSGGEDTGSVRSAAGGAGGGPWAADRDADQPSEALSGTGVDLGPAPPPDSPSGGERGQLSLFDERHLRSPQPGLSRRTAHRLPRPAAGRASAAEAGGFADGSPEALARIARQVARRTRTPLSATRSPRNCRVKNRFQVANDTSGPRSQTGPSTMSGPEAIIREAQLDGFYMLRTSEPGRSSTNGRSGAPLQGPDPGRAGLPVRPSRHPSHSSSGGESGSGLICSCAPCCITSIGI